MNNQHEKKFNISEIIRDSLIEYGYNAEFDDTDKIADKIVNLLKEYEPENSENLPDSESEALNMVTTDLFFNTMTKEEKSQYINFRSHYPLKATYDDVTVILDGNHVLFHTDQFKEELAFELISVAP